MAEVIVDCLLPSQTTVASWPSPVGRKAERCFKCMRMVFSWVGTCNMDKLFKTSLFDDCGNWWLPVLARTSALLTWAVHGMPRMIESNDRMPLWDATVRLQTSAPYQHRKDNVHYTIVEICRSSRFHGQRLSCRCVPAQFFFGCLKV